MDSPNHRLKPRSGAGFATLLVIVAVLALSLTVYSFANQAFLEHAATRASMRQTQSRLSALSGVEWIRSRLSSGNKNDRDQAIVSSNIADRDALRNDVSFEEFGASIYRRMNSGDAKALIDSPRGLASESAKLNIHSLDLTKQGESISRARLSSLPNVTPQMADALLDWIDPDDVARTFGAESQWYADNAPQYRPSNRPIQDWKDLLFVRGFTEQILFGEDTNLNGWLDWNENDGDDRIPNDDRDGKLDEGLAAFLSLDAYEWNRDRNGQPKINLNDDDLSRLFDKVATVYGEEAAIFIVTYRMDGPARKEQAYDEQATKKAIRNSLEERLDQQLTPSKRFSPDTGRFQAGARKGGVALNRRPVHRILSVIDLLDSSVLTLVDNEEKLLISPWKVGDREIHQMILDLENSFTTVPSDRLLGRIDITQASSEVLSTIPGLSRTTIDAMIALRDKFSDRDQNASIRSVYWLVENQILDLELLRSVAPFVTTEGAIYSGYSVGHDGATQSAAISRFTLSREGRVVRLLNYREVGMTPWIRQDVPYDRSRSQR